jgi:hypothetical protein
MLSRDEREIVVGRCRKLAYEEPYMAGRGGRGVLAEPITVSPYASLA